ncbi:Vid27 family protein [Lineolata rhizophorae]|uniref:Vid27 family protein n=1 Tax=Lineolata rhizophorae TaxID=578093 RepID=A0A6A6P195_9PEZI|nr:Vid27 family protein [Lineolata rhizophorae]
MFMLRNVSKYIFGDSSKETLVDVPQGQLYLVRPLSVKGYSELIFKDCAASIRRTGQEFQYQLVVQRAYEEGEEELLDEEEGDLDASVGALGSDKDEKTFLLDESLRFRADVRQTGEKVFAWRDLSGDSGDLWEFVCDQSVQPSTIQQFELVAQQCQYERKYRRRHDTATDEDLRQFSFEEEPIPNASPLASPSALSPVISPSPEASFISAGEEQAEMPSPKGKGTQTIIQPPSKGRPATKEMLAKETAQLHLFDFESGTFVLQEDAIVAEVGEIGNWNYWLQISGKDREWFGQPIVADINPVFNYEYISFIFNHYPTDGSASSWLLRFQTQEMLERFQEGLMQALWEHSNQTKWIKAKDQEREYVLEAFNDLTMEDTEDVEGTKEEEEESDEEEVKDDGERSEHYDTDESEDDSDVKGNKDGAMNSQLQVGYKHDRSFVVRGSKIGVFKHTKDNHLQFSTNINKVETPKGKLFNPSKAMLHNEDANLILQNNVDPNKLYRMDLEYGKVVDEWNVHDDIPVNVFAPDSKFAQMTGEQTFLGLSGNALYRIDPRLSGNKLVDSQLKQYVSKNDFSAAATTEKGYIAVASNKGDIRMFDRLGINAKTHIPALGDPIIGMDTSADGRWLLATTRTYLLLIDALQKEGKNEGKLGFEKPFAKDSKPQPRRLGLTPAHVAQFQHETKAPISFTPARFNTGLDGEETTIITATGPFVITWSLKKVLAGRRDPYSIKRYAEEIKADNFRFGSDKNLIVALPHDVDMIKKNALQRPTRESIMGTPGTRSSAGGRRSSARKSYLNKSDIVNSPY